MLRLSGIVVGLAALSACASVENTIVAEPGVAFSLPVGKTAVMSGSENRLTFRKVSDDSRCPKSVTCVWEGDARIEVTLTRDQGPAETRVLSLSPSSNEEQIGNLSIRFVGLAPYPSSPGPIDSRRYVAELVIRTL